MEVIDLEFLLVESILRFQYLKLMDLKHFYIIQLVRVYL